jgi:DNA (cytosine-5)-methyltransferase 1
MVIVIALQRLELGWGAGMPIVVDLFCGAGGFTEGFRQAGFETVVASDNDPAAGRTFAFNHDQYRTKFVLGDIRDAGVHDEILAHIGQREIDVIIGGPPCQAFSQVRNHQRIIEDSRNSLYREFVAMIRSGRPRTFVMENVPGMQNLAGGKVRDQILEDLAIEGEYRVESRVVDAADYGVPQNRLRVFFVGVRLDLHSAPRIPPAPTVAGQVYLERGYDGHYRVVHKPLVGKAAHEKLLDPANMDYVTVSQAIGDLLHIKPSEKKLRSASDNSLAYESEAMSAYQQARRNGAVALFNVDCPYIREDTVARLAVVPQGGNFRDIPEALCKRYLNGRKWGPELGRDNLSRKYFFAYRKLHPDYFSWTLNTKADCVYHYATPRALTVREFARLHSFDDTYHFVAGDLHSRYQQVGNAVPPLLGRAIARAVRAILDESNRQRASTPTAA